MTYTNHRRTEHLRAKVRDEKAQIITAYRAGTSTNALASRYQVTPGWLAKMFDTWGEPRRGRSAAQRLFQAHRVTGTS